MAQHYNEHPTIAQLSAYLDQELTTDELALYATHVHTCQACQSELVDLRFMATLLHNMPQVEVPRSFVLPTNLIVLPTTPVSETQPSRQGRSFMKRTLRTLSTLAAVIGLFFILAGALTSLPGSGNNSPAITTAPYVNSTHTPIQGSSTASNILTPLATATKHAEQPTLTRTANQARTPPATANTSPSQTPTFGSGVDTQQPNLPAVLDPGQSTGRLSIGVILLLLGMLGILWTRRSQHTPTP
ncbi:MAG: anti-sigma factor family protein [Ktedonobacteraceae bacterium]